jgi:hypothetical protein
VPAAAPLVVDVEPAVGFVLDEAVPAVPDVPEVEAPADPVVAPPLEAPPPEAPPPPVWALADHGEAAAYASSDAAALTINKRFMMFLL